jgi:hypothetical protein
MDTIKAQLATLIRILCILSVAALGFATITGSGDDGSSTNYDTISTTFDFDTIAVVYDGTEPVTIGAITTSMLDEAIAAGLPDADKIRIVNSEITGLQIQYDAAWVPPSGSIQNINCASTIVGDWNGSIDTRKLELGGEDWSDANAIDDATRTAFRNYLTNYKKTYDLVVSCNSDNLYNQFVLDYWISMDLILTVAYD